MIMKYDLEKIKADIKESLSSYRYNHSINVMEEAIKLGKHYHIDINKCAACALTHDLAKEFSEEENKNLIEKYNLSKDLLNEENKNLLHGILSSLIVNEKYNFTDDMCAAIKYHTTGHPGMSLLAKIIYLADKIEKGKNYPGITLERALAYQDLDKAIITCLDKQIKNLTLKQKPINKLALLTKEFLEKETNK